METFNPSVENDAEKEKGHNTEVLVRIMRHGERTKEGALTDQGREITAEVAENAGIDFSEYDEVETIGSNVDPVEETGLGRALETAAISTDTLTHPDTPEGHPEREMTGYAIDELNYKTIKTPVPYDHTAIYNSHLPDNHDELEGDELIAANKYANGKTGEHVMNLDTPEAETYRTEMAGAIARVLRTYISESGKMDDGAKKLVNAGTHGTYMEFLFQKAMLRTNEATGEVIKGFENLEEIGGDTNPSETVGFKIERNDDGEVQNISVNFESEHRPQGDIELDMDVVNELADFYEEIHKDRMDEIRAENE